MQSVLDKRKRLKLHEILCDILGSRNCYYEPPSTMRLEYPCFIYGREKSDVKYADNIRYLHTDRYMITAIDSNPDSDLPGKLFSSNLPYLEENRSPYVVDGLYHFVYGLYF